MKTMEEAYQNGETDEFILPRIWVDPDGRPIGTIQDGDRVLFFNFRADRAREITKAFIDPDFHSFAVEGRPGFSGFMTDV